MEPDVVEVDGQCICGIVKFKIELDRSMVDSISANCHCCNDRHPPRIAWAVVPWTQVRITAGAGFVNFPNHPDTEGGDQCKHCHNKWNQLCTGCGGFVRIKVDDTGPREWHVMQMELTHRKDAEFAKENFDLIFYRYASGHHADSPIDKMYEPQFFVVD